MGKIISSINEVSQSVKFSFFEECDKILGILNRDCTTNKGKKKNKKFVHNYFNWNGKRLLLHALVRVGATLKQTKVMISLNHLRQEG